MLGSWPGRRYLSNTEPSLVIATGSCTLSFEKMSFWHIFGHFINVGIRNLETEPSLVVATGSCTINFEKNVILAHFINVGTRNLETVYYDRHP